MFPSSFHDWISQYFFIFGTSWETMSNDLWGKVLRLLRKWEVPPLGAYFLSFFLISSSNICMYNIVSFLFFYLLIILSWRINTVNEFGLPLLLPEKSRILTSWLTLVICSTTALDPKLSITC